MRTYHALQFGNVCITSDGKTCQLRPRFDVRQHSVSGYSWGRPSPGAQQLALVILLDHFQSHGYRAHGINPADTNPDGSDYHIMNAVDDEAIKQACDLYMRFTTEVIAKQDRHAPFELATEQISSWLATVQEAA